MSSVLYLHAPSSMQVMRPCLSSASFVDACRGGAAAVQVELMFLLNAGRLFALLDTIVARAPPARRSPREALSQLNTPLVMATNVCLVQRLLR